MHCCVLRRKKTTITLLYNEIGFEDWEGKRLIDPQQAHPI